MASEAILPLLLKLNLAGGAAILVVLAARGAMRHWFGAGAAYALWLVVPAAVLAVMLPAREVVVAATPVQAVIAPAAAIGGAPVVEAEAIAPIDFLGLILFAWIAGAVLMLTLLVWRQAAFTGALGKLNPETRGVVRAEADGVGPAIVGALAPKLVLPRDFETRFDEVERDVVLAHECVHLRRGDPQINALAALAQCVCWFNPLVHWAAQEMRIDQELACDAAVIAKFPNQRRRYAEAMLKTQVHAYSPALVCAWPATGIDPLKQRIAMLKRELPGKKRAAQGAGAAVVLALGASVAAWAAQPATPIYETTETDASALAAIEPVPTPKAPKPRGAELAAKLKPQPDSKVIRTSAPRDSDLDASTALADAALLRAVSGGNARIAAEAIASGANVDARAKNGMTALIIASRAEDMQVLNLLLEHNADVNLVSSGEGNALVAAARRGHVRAVAALIEHGADVNAMAPGYGTPLASSVRTGQLGVVKYLVEHGANVNLASPRPEPWGRWSGAQKPLEVAIQGDHASIATYLKSVGAEM